MDRTGLPSHRRGRILYTLLGALACVALLPLVFLARQFIATNRTALETSTQEFQLQVASTVARNDEFQLEATRGQVWSTARAIGSAIHLSQGEQAKLLDDLARQGRGSDIVLMRFRRVHGEPIDSDETAPIPDVVTRELQARRRHL